MFGRSSDTIELSAERSETFPILGKRLRQTAGTMSGGEQQMLVLSRAYLTHPKGVLVDEASLGLPPLMVDKVYEAMVQLGAKGLALVVVEQYVQRALELAKKVCILSRAEVIHSGPAEAIDTDEIYESYPGIEA